MVDEKEVFLSGMDFPDGGSRIDKMAGSEPNNVMEGVREYWEQYPVKLDVDEESGREIILSKNEGGYNSTAVDLLDLVEWLRAHRPDLF